MRWLLTDCRSYRHFAYRLRRTSTLFPARWATSAGSAPAHSHVGAGLPRRSMSPITCSDARSGAAFTSAYARLASSCETSDRPRIRRLTAYADQCALRARPVRGKGEAHLMLIALRSHPLFRPDQADTRQIRKGGPRARSPTARPAQPGASAQAGQGSAAECAGGDSERARAGRGIPSEAARGAEAVRRATGHRAHVRLPQLAPAEAAPRHRGALLPLASPSPAR